MPTEVYVYAVSGRLFIPDAVQNNIGENTLKVKIIAIQVKV